MGSQIRAAQKAESARDSVTEINSLIDVRLHTERLDSTKRMEIFAQYDLIVDGTDDFATRYLVNDLLGKPDVWGSIYRFDGQASVFWAEHGPCYRCLYPEPRRPGWCPPVPRAGARRAVRLDRVDPGHRGDQAAHQHRGTALGPAGG